MIEKEKKVGAAKKIVDTAADVQFQKAVEGFKKIKTQQPEPTKEFKAFYSSVKANDSDSVFDDKSPLKKSKKNK